MIYCTSHFQSGQLKSAETKRYIIICWLLVFIPTAQSSLSLNLFFVWKADHSATEQNRSLHCLRAQNIRQLCFQVFKQTYKGLSQQWNAWCHITDRAYFTFLPVNVTFLLYGLKAAYINLPVSTCFQKLIYFISFSVITKTFPFFRMWEISHEAFCKHDSKACQKLISISACLMQLRVKPAFEFRWAIYSAQDSNSRLSR